MGLRSKVAVITWNDVYLACKAMYPDRFDGFDGGQWTGCSWQGQVLFRQERLDGEPPINDGVEVTGDGELNGRDAS